MKDLILDMLPTMIKFIVWLFLVVSAIAYFEEIHEAILELSYILLFIYYPWLLLFILSALFLITKE